MASLTPDDLHLPGLALLAAITVPLWLARADGTVLWLNGAARRLCGGDDGAGDLRFDPLDAGRALLRDGNGGRWNLAVRAAPAPGGENHPDGPLRLMEGLAPPPCATPCFDGATAHRLLLDAIDSIGDGFVLYDADDRLVLFNRHYRELMIGDPELAQPGTRFETVLREGARRGLYRIPPEETEAWIAARLHQHRHGGPPMEVQLRSGRWLRIEERRTSDGGTVGLRTDVTDLKSQALELAAARDLAERVNQRKTDYVHHLSHELRTPLTAVIGFAEIMRDQIMGPLDNPRYRDAAAQIATAGDYMLELVNNLLDLARIEAGGLDLHEEDCLLGQLVDATLAMMAGRAERAGVRLAATLPEDLPRLRGDPSLIRQMLTNLIGNAVKFTPAGGHVAVRAGRDGDGALVLSVADDGRGMATDSIPRALTAFSQVHDRMTVPEHGSGLGLPLTAALIALHGGGMALDSTPGHGTTVRLRFPPERVADGGCPHPIPPPPLAGEGVGPLSAPGGRCLSRAAGES